MENFVELSTEAFFDLSNGKLLIGRVAVNRAIESGIPPAEIKELSQLLTQPERPIGPDEFPSVDYNKDWDAINDVVAARWLHEVVSSRDSNKALSEEVLIRASYLGLVPRINYFRTREGKLNGLYTEAELNGTRTRGLFDSWTKQDFVTYIQRLAAELGDKPSPDDLKAAGYVHGNPTVTQILHRFKRGGLPSLFELAGYPNIKSWNRQDYINWGVHFTFANNGQVPNSRSMAKLSTLHRGPHYTSIYDNVGSIREYQQIVSKEYIEELERRVYKQETSLHKIKNGIEDGSYPRTLFDKADSEASAVSTHSRYVLAQHLLPNITDKQLISLAKIKTPGKLVAGIIAANPSITTAHIETAATILDVFDDIWPLDDHLEYLRV